MGDALDDLYDRLERMDTYCPKHKVWFEELGFGCPKCEWEAEEQADLRPDAEGED